VVTVGTASKPDDTFSSTANCGSGKIVTGGGFRTTGSMRVLKSEPNGTAPPIGWRVTASGSSLSTIQAVAVCADTP
jgi:hypothetical protein